MRPHIWLLIILLAFIFALYTGAAGVDFGTQWDQNIIKGHVNKYVRTGNILPGEYHYPPGPSYIAATTTIPYALPFVLRYGTNWVPTQNYLLSEVLQNPNQAFLLNLRRVFVFFTSGAVLWAGLAAGQRDRLAGVVAAALLAFSWEVNYQSRFVHPDGPTMQFVALVLFLGFMAFYKARPFSPQVWLYLAAVASAIATATKYTAGISLLTVLLLAFIVWRREVLPLTQLWLRWAGLSLVFGLAFLLLVPGVLLEQDLFLTQVVADRVIYASGHGLQTVEAGWDYLSRVLVYLFAVSFSPYPVLALMVTALMLLGAYVLLVSDNREERWLGLILFGVPTLYILFLATHRVLFVRNLLQVLPSLAMLAGFGFRWIVGAFSKVSRGWQLAPMVALIILLGFNSYWITDALRTIQMRHSDIFIYQALDYIAGHPEQQIYVTPAAAAILNGHTLPPNLTIQKSGSETLVLFAYLADVFDKYEGSWPVNALGASPLIFGPKEINMDWYASWPGVERLVLASPQLAWEAGRRFDPEQRPAEILPAQHYSGLLTRSGQQLMLERKDAPTLFIMNSANPKILLELWPLLHQQVSVTAHPHSQSRIEDVYVLSINGKEILLREQLRDEYSFSRFSLHLTHEQKECLRLALGDANYRSLEDHWYSFMEYPEQLQVAVACAG